jgi:hypothetical protein
VFDIRSTPPESAVPSGRLGYDMRNDVLLLHTVQNGLVLDALLADGEWIPEHEQVDPVFAESYEWLYEQMSERLGEHCSSAVWFWAKTTRSQLVDICRTAARHESSSVLLTCRIPRERVLLSHFNDWHCVLNDTINVLPLPGETEDEWEARWEPMHNTFHDALDAARRSWLGGAEFPRHAWPAELRAQAEASWRTIVDPTGYLAFAGNRRSWPGIWQATAPRLLTADVVDAVRLG